MVADDVMLVWGKAGRGSHPDPHPLLCHLLDVAAVCEALLPRFGSALPLPPRWIAYLAGLHDIGKADPLFQNKEPALAQRLRAAGLDLPVALRPFRHEARSAEWVLAHLQRCHGWGRAAALLASQAVAGHHGHFQPDDSCLDEPVQQRPEWPRLRARFAAALAEALALDQLKEPGLTHASRAGAVLAGLIVLSDWIASNEEVFHYPSLPSEAPAGEYLAAAREEARRALTRLRFDVATGPPAPPSFAAVWPQHRTMRPVQQAVEDLCRKGVPPGLAIIEAPTGEGKTEAAIYLSEYWRHATGRNGAYLALPTAATSSQMHARYSAFLRHYRPDAEPVLVHGMAWLLDEASPAAAPALDGDPAAADAARDWFRNLRRALLAPEGVGTVDQALLAALHVNHGVLRLFGLASKVLIIDEVHAYDAYMSAIMRRLLQWCRAMGVPVILLSATLSSAQRRELAEAYGGPGTPPDASHAYPLLTVVPLDGASSAVAVHCARTRRVQVRCHPGLLRDLRGTAALAASLARAGGCACVVANTVAEAQAIYRALKEMALPNAELLLFHARFRADRRQVLEQNIVRRFGKTADSRPPRAVLVATQVAEQSLDIDFDVMVSQLAPVDLLLQRAGRLHRHDRGLRPAHHDPVLHVLLPHAGSLDFGAAAAIYHRLPLLRTLALLRGRNAFDVPDDFRTLVEACYARGAMSEDVVPAPLLAEAERDRCQARKEAEALAGVHLIPEPSPREFRLALVPHRPVAEGEEGKAADYFHAQTRLGRPHRRVLLLDEETLAQAAQRDTPPDRDTLRRLFLHTAEVPVWWLHGLNPARGFAEIQEGPRWLNRWPTIPLRTAEWRGVDDRGRAVVMRDDPELGLVRESSDGDETDAGV